MIGGSRTLTALAGGDAVTKVAATRHPTSPRAAEADPALPPSPLGDTALFTLSFTGGRARNHLPEVQHIDCVGAGALSSPRWPS